MVLHVFMFVFLLVVCFFLSLALLWYLDCLSLQPSSSRGGTKRTRLQRLLKPRSPDDCPACRLASTVSSGVKLSPPPVRPWHEVKSGRGAPKHVNTEGYACPNQQCTYFGITAAHMHAAFWRWRAWLGRADPDLPLSSLLYHVQCPAQHALVPIENPFPAGRHRVVCTGRRAGCIRGRTRLRLSTSHHYHLVVSRWLACTGLARALLPHPLAPASSVG